MAVTTGDVSLYEYRTLLGVFQTAVDNPTFLRDRYFPNVRAFMTDSVDIDIKDDKARDMAPFVGKRSEGSVGYLSGYRTQTYKPAKIAPMIVIDGDDAFTRAPGATIYDTMNPDARRTALVVEAMSKLDNAITRREEWMASQALFTGKIPIVNTEEGIDDVMDFWAGLGDKKPEATADKKWDSTATGANAPNPINDLCEMFDRCARTSGLTPVEVIMGAKAWKCLLTYITQKYPNYFDNKRIHLGDIEPRALPQGVSYKGRLLEPAVDIYTYSGFYDGVDGEPTPFVPENDVLMACAGVETLRAYGRVDILTQDLKEVSVAAPRVPNSWVQRTTPAGRVVQVTSRPLVIINRPMGFHVLHAITNS